MIVQHSGSEVLVDLAIDSPPVSTPTVTLLGPTLVPLDLAGRELLALFGRAEARDFADVLVLAQRFGKEALLEPSPGAGCWLRLGCLRADDGHDGPADDEIPLAAGDVPLARGYFRAWVNEVADGLAWRNPICSRFQRHPAMVGRVVIFGWIEWNVSGHFAGGRLRMASTSAAASVGDHSSRGVRRNTWNLSVVMKETTNRDASQVLGDQDVERVHAPPMTRSANTALASGGPEPMA